MNHFARGIFAAYSMFVSVNAFSQSLIAWDTRGAIMAGTGCSKDSTDLIESDGTNLKLILSSFYLDLTGSFANAPLAERSNCTIRIPVTVAPGYYISRIVQKIKAEVQKTSRSQGSVASNFQFFGFNLSPFTIQVPFGPRNGEIMQQRIDSIAVNSSMATMMCSSRPTRGLMELNFAISGQRSSIKEDLLIAFDGEYDIKLGSDFQLSRCAR